MGWPIGLRFDPLIYCENWRHLYQELIAEIMDDAVIRAIHSVSYGPLRYPKQMYQQITKLYPDEVFFASSMTQNQGFVSYGEAIEREMSDYLSEQLINYISTDNIFQCVIK